MASSRDAWCDAAERVIRSMSAIRIDIVSATKASSERSNFCKTSVTCARAHSSFLIYLTANSRAVTR